MPKKRDVLDLTAPNAGADPKPYYGPKGEAHKLRKRHKAPGGFEPKVRPGYQGEAPPGTTGVAT
jgi:hypothetical protein